MDSAYSLVESPSSLLHTDNCPSSSPQPSITFPRSCSSPTSAASPTVTTPTSTTTIASTAAPVVATTAANLSHTDLETHSPSLGSFVDPFDGFSSFLIDQHYYSGNAIAETSNSLADSCDRNSSSSHSSSYAMDPLDQCTFSSQHQISSSSSPCLLMAHQHRTHNHQHHHNYHHQHHNQHLHNIHHQHHISSLTTINSSSSTGSSSSCLNNHNNSGSNRNISSSIESSDNNFSFQTDPDQEDPANNDLPETLTSFVADLSGVSDSDAGYNSGVDLFCSSHASMIDCCESHSPEAYYLRLALEHQHQDGGTNCATDLRSVYNEASSNMEAGAVAAAKRSVLMNLLINGSDASAGYSIHNCRAQH